MSESKEPKTNTGNCTCTHARYQHFHGRDMKKTAEHCEVTGCSCMKFQVVLPNYDKDACSAGHKGTKQ